jgi:Zn-dependent protease
MPDIGVETVFFLGVVSSCVIVLHELGHCLVAKAFGIKVVDITLWPLGGMARMTEIPENTKIESLIAIAGPAVNFVLAGLALIFLLLLGSPLLPTVAGSAFPAQFAAWFLAWNLLLGVFNLIPAFPMDGGRILRALLGARGDWVVATEKAVKVGRWFAIAMVLAGLVWPGRVGIMPLIGIFIWFSGSRELFAVRLRHGIHPLARALGLDPDVLRGAAPRPVQAETSRPAHPKPQDPTGARRPEFDWSGPNTSSGRISDEEIERLERYRGRLPR